MIRFFKSSLKVSTKWSEQGQEETIIIAGVSLIIRPAILYVYEHFNSFYCIKFYQFWRALTSHVSYLKTQKFLNIMIRFIRRSLFKPAGKTHLKQETGYRWESENVLSTKCEKLENALP